MTQYVKMNTDTGEVDASSIRTGAPTVLEKGNIRWLEIVSNQNSPWQYNASLPTTAALDATTISLSVVTTPLAGWKELLVSRLRTEAGTRINAAAPSHLQMNMLARATELTHKATSEQLSVEEEAEIAAFQSLWADTINPIRQACNDAEAAVNAAEDHAAAETAFAAVDWP